MNSDNLPNPPAEFPNPDEERPPIDLPSPSSPESSESEQTTDATDAVDEILANAVEGTDLELGAESSEPPAVQPLNLPTSSAEQNQALEQELAELRQQNRHLQQDLAELQQAYEQQKQHASTSFQPIVQQGAQELEEQRQAIKLDIEQLERRQQRIQREMQTTFAGASQDIAIRVQGFKDYLVGSLQDLAAAAEQLNLVPEAPPAPLSKVPVAAEGEKAESSPEGMVSFADQAFREQQKKIRKLIDQYRANPDYYGPPWQLRRTFEPAQAERVSNWFFDQGGRGAVKTMGSRLQNILVASAAISILDALYGDRLRVLVLANSPERLGEWRRGLQDCLGISRGDFGPDQGIILFEAPAPVALKAERLMKIGDLPLIIVDESESSISLGLLQFPMWLAFAPDPSRRRYEEDDYYEDDDFDF